MKLVRILKEIKAVPKTRINNINQLVLWANKNKKTIINYLIDNFTTNNSGWSDIKDNFSHFYKVTHSLERGPVVETTDEEDNYIRISIKPRGRQKVTTIMGVQIYFEFY